MPSEDQEVRSGALKAGFYIYRCQMCEKKYVPKLDAGEVGHSMSEISSVALRALNISPGPHDPITPPETILHGCENGGTGRARLIGWMPIENQEIE